MADRSAVIRCVANSLPFLNRWIDHAVLSTVQSINHDYLSQTMLGNVVQFQASNCEIEIMCSETLAAGVGTRIT